MIRQFETRDPSIEALRHAPIYFCYGSCNKRRVFVDLTTARAVLACYDSLSAAGKPKFERYVAVSLPDQFQRLVAFCFKHVTF